jgi:hypothetical protein
MGLQAGGKGEGKKGQNVQRKTKETETPETGKERDRESGDER